MDSIELKLAYLKELRQLIESSSLTSSRKIFFLEKAEAVCQSIDKDLAIGVMSSEGKREDTPYPQG